MTHLHVSLLGAVRELEAAELPSVSSVLTGRPLRRFALQLHVPDERHQELDAELRAAESSEGKPLQGPDTAWIVSDGWTTTSQGRRPEIYIYRLEVEEAEVLHASAVEIGGLSLLPIRYKERVAAGKRTMTLVSEVAGEDSERLEALLGQPASFHDVVRRGISDTPLRMRLGRCVWQRSADGTRRHHLELLSDEGTSAPAPSPLALTDRLDRTVERVVAHSEVLTALIEELHLRGVLSESALHTLGAAAAPRSSTPREERELCRTERLSDYWH